MKRWAVVLICTVGIFLASCGGNGGTGTPRSGAAPAGQPHYDAPVLSAGVATPATIPLNVTAGASGAPNGFTLQWTLAAGFSGQWPDPAMCEAGFAGNAQGHNFSLAPGGSVNVVVGNLANDSRPGVSFSPAPCGGPLACGTGYIFRSFAHGDNQKQRSSWSADFSTATASCPVITWAKTYGGTNYEQADDVRQTSDGGYILTGLSCSFSAGNCSGWASKLDPAGNTVWQKVYSDLPSEIESVQQTSDGGYIMSGIASVLVGGVCCADSAWVLKLGADGHVIWQKSYRDAEGAFIQQTSDGGYILAVKSLFFGFGYDARLVKLDGSGNIVWQKDYDGGGDESALSVQQTADGNYILAGFNNEGHDAGSAWALKVDGNGNSIWQNKYGTSGEIIFSARATPDGGYIMAGATPSSGGSAVWVLKLHADGSVDWQKSYGGAVYDYALSIQPTPDGGSVVGAETCSLGAGNCDFWVLKLDGSGNVVWQKTYGGTDYEEAHSIQRTSDGGFVMGGTTCSFGAGGCDAWVLKMDAGGSISGCVPPGIGVPSAGASAATSAAVAATGIVPFVPPAGAADISTAPVDTTATSAVQCTG